jgi:hypothetical protein
VARWIPRIATIRSGEVAIIVAIRAEATGAVDRKKKRLALSG